MSVARELREAMTNLEARTAELVTANAMIHSLEAAVAGHVVHADALAAQIADQAVVIAGHDGVTAALTARITALEAENAGMRMTLGNPAFKQAAVDGEPLSAAGGGGEAGADEMPTWSAYNAIKDPASRSAFWEANAAKLNEEQRRKAGK